MEAHEIERKRSKLRELSEIVWKTKNQEILYLTTGRINEWRVIWINLSPPKQLIFLSIRNKAPIFLALFD